MNSDRQDELFVRASKVKHEMLIKTQQKEWEDELKEFVSTTHHDY